jgi:putative FmdB family regulatory protein
MMPEYEYKCLECENNFEEIQSIFDESIPVCPKCGGKSKKLISLSSSNVEYSNPKELLEKVIKPDAKRIADKIKAGDQDLAANIFGEDN